jgi:hypothetical protein
MAIISAPAAGSTTTALAPFLATTGGENFTTGSPNRHIFPLLQTTLVLDATSIKADSVVNAAGGGATAAPDSFTIDINGFHGVPDQSGYPDLDWTRVGYWSTGGAWDYIEDVVRHRGVFVDGYETPAAGMPTTGSATFSGKASGSVFVPVAQGTGAALCNCGESPVSGTASFTANFGTRSLAGTLTGMTTPHPWDESSPNAPWNDVAFSATISGNIFSGDSRVTSVPLGPVSMAPNATGTLEGKFFGPSAQEAGAVWTLFDGTKAAIGTLTGKRP